ncbi:MAG TPA: SDR family NAD(P)-dependent oxidoreductase [Vicinamibacterales bacterium]|nr:SDR family NAD(P)-dependent oxidoreductase [Vicinamibacterales bacterium]
MSQWQQVKWKSLVELLQFRAGEAADRTVFTFVADGEREGESLTYAQLDCQARSIAAWLQRHDLCSERVLLLYPPGLDFICGLLGCLYAGAVAVPAYPPPAKRQDPRITAIQRDAQATVVFSQAKLRGRLGEQLSRSDVQFLGTDEIPNLSADWKDTGRKRQGLAWLQYTSGSTADPKGVMVTHENVLHNAWYISRFTGVGPQLSQVTWLPFFHDFGLIAGVVTPIYAGCRSYVLPPAAFVQSPIRLLRTIDRYRSHATTGPNFMFDACVDDTSPEEREGLDLSSWKMAWNGAEPVRAETLRRFTEAYRPYGFDPSAHKPGYGLAEATLCVSACPADQASISLTCRSDALQRHQVEICEKDDPLATTLVGSGRVGGQMRVEIVNPQTRTRCAPGEVGEIWISGPGVTLGYWNQPELTFETFQARIVDFHGNSAEEGPWLRSGDLGFLRDGELFVAGRLKDLMIIRGRNVYPQDVEHVVEQSHQALRSGSCAAFAVDQDGREELAVVVEMKRAGRRSVDLEDIFANVVRSCLEHFELRPQTVVVVKPYGTPKTSSGKVMRNACRARFQAGDLAVVGQWQAPPENRSRTKPTPSSTRLIQRLRDAPDAGRHRMILEQVLQAVAWIQELDSVPDPRAGFVELGIDSVKALKLTGMLKDAFGSEIDLSSTLLFDQPHSEAVARYIESELFPTTQPSSSAPRRARSVESEAVAIVGMSCRFPAAKDIEAFWRLLEDGRDGVVEVPPARGWAASVSDGRGAANYAALVDGIDLFDSGFFGISPREAESMDPQQRLLLEQAICALEDGCFAASSLTNTRTGVFVGISTNDYLDVLKASGNADLAAYFGTGTSHSAAAGRLSYFLGLKGPCLAIDTACSASLVAVHLACESLRSGQCDLALSGGVNAILTPGLSLVFAEAKMLSPSGRCRTFDASADGYVRGEGCGVVVLKRLSDAQRDRDRIIAVIRGSAVNQNGRTSGLTVPSGPSQQQLIADALSQAGVTGSDIGYLEAHGTATPLGDPIEIKAAAAVLARDRPPAQPLLIGSVKTNIGHLESAAGIAGLIKTSLALERGSIPPHLNVDVPNPHIPWRDYSIRIATERERWPAGGRRLAAVSSFGFSGTNAHAILEQAPAPPDSSLHDEQPMPRGVHLLALSGRTAKALADLAERYALWLDGRRDVNLDDLCFSVNTGRDHHEHRAGLVFADRGELAAQLRAVAEGRHVAGVWCGVRDRAQAGLRVAFLFRESLTPATPGARSLYETEPAIREFVDRYGSQPGCLLQAALGALWESWGVRPEAMIAGDARIESCLKEIQTRAIYKCAPVKDLSYTEFDVAVELNDSTSVQVLRKAASLYAGGIDFVFSAIEQPWRSSRSKLSLPNYPFQRARFWAEPRQTSDAEFSAARDEKSIYAIRWQLKPNPVRPDVQADAQDWIIFSDRGGVGERLATDLREGNARSVKVVGFASSSEGLHDLRVPDAFPQATAPNLHAVHLCSLDSPDAGDVWAAQETGSWSALSLVQALAASAADVRLTIVTRQSQAVDETGLAIRPEHGPLWALGRTIAAEHPEMRCRRVDIGTDVDVPAIYREIVGAEIEEPEVALRGTNRYVARLRRLEGIGGLPQSARARIRRDGTYLITGGFGGIGREITEWLIEHGAGAIAIVSRKGLDSQGAKSAVEEWKARGADVQVYRADVSSLQDLSEVWRHVRNGKMPLRGIIHAAGVIDDGVLLQQTRERFAHVMRPKVLGAWNLHQLSQTEPGEELQHFICFSSLASVVGAAGQASYVAANGFLDALAHYRRQLGLPALTINWGPWSNVGMAARKAPRIAGLAHLTSRRGLELFEKTLGLAEAQVLAADVDWDELSNAYGASRQVALVEHVARTAGQRESGFRQTLEALPKFERGPALTAHVRKAVSNVLGYPAGSSIDLNQRLFDAGMDSLMAVELRNRLSAETGIVLPPTLVFRNPSVSQLATQLASMLGIDVSASIPAGAPFQGDDERSLLETIRGLSDEEAARLIEAEAEEVQ